MRRMGFVFAVMATVPPNFCAVLIRSRAASFDYPSESRRLNVLYAWPERGADKISSEGVYRNVVSDRSTISN